MDPAEPTDADWLPTGLTLENYAQCLASLHRYYGLGNRPLSREQALDVMPAKPPGSDSEPRWPEWDACWRGVFEAIQGQRQPVVIPGYIEAPH